MCGRTKRKERKKDFVKFICLLKGMREAVREGCFPQYNQTTSTPLTKRLQNHINIINKTKIAK